MKKKYIQQEAFFAKSQGTLIFRKFDNKNTGNNIAGTKY